MADTPNAEADCFRHSVQWQTYKSSGLGREARSETVPHWHVIAAMFDVPVMGVRVALALGCNPARWRL
jgi:hypothetical protein